MNSSIDWTSPDAYQGRIIPAPPKRSWPAQAAGLFRVMLRRRRRDRRARIEAEALYLAGRDMSDHMRRDIGLPPY